MNPCVYKRPLFFVLLLLIVRILLFYRPTPFSKDISRFISKETVHVIGRVESFAVQKQKTDNIVVAVQKINRQPADGYLYARVQDISPSWKDTVQLTGVLKEPYGTDLIGNFNWRAYLTYKNVFTEMRVQKTHLVKRAAFPYRFIRKVRSSILETFASHFATPLPQIAGGILLGERGDLPPTLFTAFQDSGAIHLLVASGGNVGFVTLLVLACCGLFSIGRRKALLAALIAAGVYTFLAGADAPLVRAYFMTVCATLGYLFRRNSGVFQGLLISCFVILLLGI